MNGRSALIVRHLIRVNGLVANVAVSIESIPITVDKHELAAIVESLADQMAIPRRLLRKPAPNHSAS